MPQSSSQFEDEQFEAEERQRSSRTSDSIWRAIAALYHKKWLILGTSFVAAVIAAVISLQMPNWYASSARVLAPEAGSANPLSAAMLKNIPSAASALLGGGSSDYARYLTILSSRKMQEDAVKQFNLIKVYELEEEEHPLEAAIDEFSKHVGLEVDPKYEYLSVSVADTDPKRSAQIVNYLIQRLNEINSTLNTQSASSYRKFVEARYNEAQRSLDSVLTATQQFQQRYSVYDLPRQTEAYFQQLAEMRAQSVQAEIQYEVLRNQYGAENSQVKQLQDAVNASRSRYQAALQGNEALLPVPQANMSTVVRQYIDLERERLMQVRILEVIGPLYEQARFDEEKKTEALQIVDPAVPPVKKIAPKRSIIVLSVAAATFLLTVLYVLAQAWWKRHHASIAARLQSFSARTEVEVPSA